MANKYWISNLCEIAHVTFFECADFKFAICFWKLRAEIPKFGHFVPKSINSLILTKFRVYSFSKVLILNLTLVFKNVEPKCPNLGNLNQKYQFSNLNKISLVSYFKGTDFKFDFRIREFWNFITSCIKMNNFVFWFYLLN